MSRLVRTVLGGVLVSLLVGCATSSRPTTAPADSTLGVVGVREAQLTPDFWIGRAARPDKLVLSVADIAAQNQRLHQVDRSVNDIERFPPTLVAADVTKWISELSGRPTKQLFDERGQEVSEQAIGQLLASVNLGAVPPTQPARYGLVVQRADLRTFPTNLRVFSARGDTDIDRFQESSLFPGTPVVIAHVSRDGKWWFVVSPLYAAWIEQDRVAEGTSQQVFGYTHKSPYVVVTGAKANTVFTPERPELSDLQLDMGVRVPLLKDWPVTSPVNGQHPYTAHVVELPYRAADGSLQFSPALLPKTDDVAEDYLSLTQANVLRQGFKFLGERYGWGHSYNARDCSGFVSEVYRSFGVQLPRNTRDQGVSPALNRITFTEEDSHEARLAVLQQLQVG
ncbi:MAG TPA: SH3 domain-containing protein, partial [Povalibacter sp.]